MNRWTKSLRFALLVPSLVAAVALWVASSIVASNLLGRGVSRGHGGVEAVLLLGVATLGVLAAFLLLLVTIRRRVLAPLRAIKSGLRARGQDGPGARIAVSTQDEFAAVARELNASFDALDAQQRELRKLALIATETSSIAVVARPDGVIEWVNDSFARVTGLPREHAIGGRANDLPEMPAADRKRLMDAWARLSRGEVVEVAYSCRARDGRQISIEAEGRPLLDEAGRVTAIVLLGDDVTEQREMREQLLTVAAGMQREIAYDLHDHVGGDLGGLALRAKRLAARLATERHPEADAASELTQELGRVAAQTRHLSHLLAPTSAELGGMDAALAQLCESARGYAGLRSRLRTAGPKVQLPQWQAEQVYLIAQEAVRNSLKHARPTQILIVLSARTTGLLLQVTNDGSSWDPATVRKGLGLRTMQYRAQVLGGTLQLRARPHGVTSVRFFMPLESLQAIPRPINPG